jgi:hypothetical protein
VHIVSFTFSERTGYSSGCDGEKREGGREGERKGEKGGRREGKEEVLKKKGGEREVRSGGKPN